MREVGIRELKSRLSYYVQLMQAGETVAIKVRNHVVGFLSRFGSPPAEKQPIKKPRKDIRKLVEKWKQEGFVVSGGPYRYIPFHPVKLKGDLTASEMIRQMRDEDL